MVLGFQLNKQENKQETSKKWRGELTKGRNGQLPAVHVYSQRGARGVRGAVFRDIDEIPHRPHRPQIQRYLTLNKQQK